MAAGQGFKTFTTGEVLTAADVNGYLMQGVLVFASAAARNAAITSPQEGQFAYTKDTNGLWYYDGAAWIASGATGDIEGVSVTSPITGGGTSGTVTIGIDSTAVVPSQTGNSGKYLTTNGTAASWATVAGGSMTSLASGSLSGSSVSLTSIDQTYKALRLVMNAASLSGSDQAVLRFNNDSSSSYCQGGAYSGPTSGTYSQTGTIFKLNASNASAAQNNHTYVIDIPNYAVTNSVKLVSANCAYYNITNSGWANFLTGCTYFSESAITSIQMRADYGGAYTWDNGTYILYGVN